MPWRLSQVAMGATFRSWMRPDNISLPMISSPAVQIRSLAMGPQLPQPAGVAKLACDAYIGGMTDYVTADAAYHHATAGNARNGAIKLHCTDGFERMSPARRPARADRKNGTA